MIIWYISERRIIRKFTNLPQPVTKLFTEYEGKFILAAADKEYFGVFSLEEMENLFESIDEKDYITNIDYCKKTNKYIAATSYGN